MQGRARDLIRVLVRSQSTVRARRVRLVGNSRKIQAEATFERLEFCGLLPRSHHLHEAASSIGDGSER